jgi:hypothetical protein
LLRTTLLVIILIVTGLVALSEVGVNIGPLLAGAGIIGVAIGFGSQKLVQDLITGIFLLLENAMQVGDNVTVSGLSGTVENLSIRTIRLRAADGSVHLIPFSSVTSVTNVNRGLGNAAVSVAVAYNENTDRVGEVLQEIARKTYPGRDGAECPLLTPDEVRLLSMRKGSLDANERAEIESHVVYSYNFLKQIPWTNELRNVPEIARHHHEKLNGKGYPLNLSCQEIPLASRMMAIADVFDALAASDRPYKPSVSVERALEILGEMARNGEIDPQLYSLFVQNKVYELWKIDCFEY